MHLNFFLILMLIQNFHKSQYFLNNEQYNHENLLNILENQLNHMLNIHLLLKVFFYMQVLIYLI